MWTEFESGIASTIASGLGGCAFACARLCQSPYYAKWRQIDKDHLWPDQEKSALKIKIRGKESFLAKTLDLRRVLAPA
jgi:hypothetical protein